MSHVGRLPTIKWKFHCGSETEALRHLKELKERGFTAFYIRHGRESFTVVVKEVSDAQTKD